MIGASLPKITCVVVTKGRTNMIVNAINYFIKQSYTNKDMVIVSQGDCDKNKIIQSYVNELNRSDISVYTVHPNTCLGNMRNTSVEIARGDIICQWDDDDIYHPERLMSQYKVLRSNSSNIASLYCAFLKYYKTTNEIYWCDWSGEPIPSHRYLCGSIMFHREAFGLFPVFYPQIGMQSNVEEDLNVLEKLQSKGKIAGLWDAWQYIYVYHGDNVYDIVHHNYTLNTSTGKIVLGKQGLMEKEAVLRDSFSAVGLKDRVIVRSLDEMAFAYENG